MFESDLGYWLSQSWKHWHKNHKCLSTFKIIRALSSFGGCCLKVWDICMDFWSLFTLKASNLVKWLLSTWSFMWWSRNSYLDCFFQTILFSAKIIRNRYTVKLLKMQLSKMASVLIFLGWDTYNSWQWHILIYESTQAPPPWLFTTSYLTWKGSVRGQSVKGASREIVHKLTHYLRQELLHWHIAQPQGINYTSNKTVHHHNLQYMSNWFESSQK